MNTKCIKEVIYFVEKNEIFSIKKKNIVKAFLPNIFYLMNCKQKLSGLLLLL